MTDEIVKVEQTVQLGSLITEPSAVVQRATVIATQLAQIVNDRKLYTVIKSKKFVQVEGWETLGAMLGVIPREVDGRTVRYDNGTYEATVELVRVSDGAIIGRGSAICGMDEENWANRLEYARRSMAITRATGKAFRLAFSWIMALAGYEPTPAEEMDSVIEGEIKEIPKAQPKKKNGNAAKSWPGYLVQALVKVKLAENPQNAVAILNLSNLDPKKATPEIVVDWGRLYRGWRDSDKIPEQAAELANEGKLP